MLAILLCFAFFLCGAANNITIDDTNPQIVYSPPPCSRQDKRNNGCTSAWQTRQTPGAFNGTVTEVTSGGFQQGNVLPRVILQFQGTDIIFIPGINSTAQASVVVDYRNSVLLNTSKSAFAGIGLDPTVTHTISITFVPSDVTTTLAIDYFQITQPTDMTITTTSTSSLYTMSLPTTLPSSTQSPSSTPSPSPQSVNAISQPTVPIGTIAAVSLSGATVLILGILGFMYAARRRRRRDALRRERSILHDMHLPSERQSSRRQSSKMTDNLADPFSIMGAREKHMTSPSDALSESQAGEEPELDWRVATPPPPTSQRASRPLSGGGDFRMWP